MSKPTLAILDAAESTVERAVLGDLCEIVCYDAKSHADIPATVGDATIVEVWHTIHVDAALLSRLTSCRLIVRMGVGYDNVDVAAAGALGIAVANVPDYGTEEAPGAGGPSAGGERCGEVADSALCLILGLCRGALQGAQLLAGGSVIRGADGIARAVP